MTPTNSASGWPFLLTREGSRCGTRARPSLTRKRPSRRWDLSIPIPVKEARTTATPSVAGTAAVFYLPHTKVIERTTPPRVAR